MENLTSSENNSSGGDKLVRGVENPEIIDLITPDPSTGDVLFVILEKREWGADPRQLHQFDEKLNRYLGYIIDGFFVKEYPQYKGRGTTIQIDCIDAPTSERERQFMEGVAMVCEQHGIGFRIRALGKEALS